MYFSGSRKDREHNRKWLEHNNLPDTEKQELFMDHTILYLIYFQGKPILNVFYSYPESIL